MKGSDCSPCNMFADSTDRMSEVSMLVGLLVNLNASLESCSADDETDSIGVKELLSTEATIAEAREVNGECC